MAPLCHNLNGVTKQIPPGIKIGFDLFRSQDSFVLMRYTPDSAVEDKEDYQMVIRRCSLFVKVAMMSLPLYRELHSSLQHEPIRYYFRQVEVKVCNIYLTSDFNF